MSAGDGVAKRLLDVFASVVGLVVLSPVLVALAVAVRGFLGAPVLFRQMRPGRDGVPFELVKFRSMLEARDDRGALLPDEERLTSFGSWLRSTSLDELPELANVLRGEMSLVGPRPLLGEYLVAYTSHQMRRHEVRPGLTGWAQVKGRNDLAWEDRFDLDVWYVDNRTIWLDLRILALTLWRVITRQGVAADGHATSPPFTEPSD